MTMLITATIKPNSKHREEVAPNDDGSVTIYTKAPAIENRANEAVTKLLAKHFGVSKGQVKLVRGQAAKRKIFEIDIPST